MVGFSTIDRYIVRSYFVSFLLVLLIFFFIFMLAEFLTHFDRFLRDAQEQGWPLYRVVFHYFLVRFLRYYYRFGPVVILMSGLFVLVRMKRYREVTALLSAGVSAQRICAPFLWMGAVLSLTLVLDMEYGLPLWPYKRPSPSFLREIIPETLLDKDGHAIHIFRYLPESRELVCPKGKSLAVLIVKRDERKRPLMEIGARYGRWDVQRRLWHLEDGYWIRYGREANRFRFRVRVERFKSYEFRSDITPLDVESTSHAEEYIPLRRLWEQYKKRPQPHLRVQMHGRVAYFFHSLVLLMIGLSLLMQREKLNIFIGVGICTLISAIFIGVGKVFFVLGTEGVLAPVVAAWFPVAFFGVIGIELYGRMRT